MPEVDVTTRPRMTIARIADDLESYAHDLREYGRDDTAGWIEQRVEVLRRALEGLSADTAEKPQRWDDNRNRSYEPVEKLAQQIYEAFPFVNERGEPMPGKKPAWMPHGNGLKQDQARREARERLRADGHVPQS